MADRHETTADIIAEMETERPGLMNGPINTNNSYYARRLKAALERERGDCAKLREALEKIHTIAKTFIDATKMRRVTDSVRLDVSNIKDLADAALATLSVPPRNCDKYPTFNDAIRALADKRGWHDGKWNSERYCILAQWLFALATEGENDGNE